MSFLVVLYFVAVAVLCIYGAHRSSMVWQLLLKPYRDPACPKNFDLPAVCVQIPLYNEARVAERVIRAVSDFSYPKELLEIQVLDDSTDETVQIVDSLVHELRGTGVPIRVLRRIDRSEYKAGALKRGMELSPAQFFAVFDADFVPPADFLEQTIPHFEDDEIAFVQTRWGHLNRKQSFLTAAQAVLIDGHFVVEHAARAQGAFFNFNGTAGVWRRQAIDSAGGWQGDTVTEDLDLSYRVFLDGWRAVYLRNLVCMSELPSTIAAFKSQQFRWMKGAAQVSRKLLPAILRSNWSLRQKAEAFFHLTANFCYVFMVVAALLLVPVALIRLELFIVIGLWFELAIFFFTLGSMFFFYGYSQLIQGRKLSFYDVLRAIVVGVGMGAHCAKASVAGLTSWSGEFVRTPKSGVTAGQAPLGLRSALNLQNLLKHSNEVFMALYLGIGTLYLASVALWLTIPFVLLIFSGYASVLYSAALSDQ
jgi:cellulose synthase/poly-beta-1,6-N-acetylglucosamine synthase-like glycosyltransferase